MIQNPASDTAAILLRQSAADSIYLEILEKTNQQLSLWWNPYGVMVAVLGVLFAILALVATIVIWRQGRTYQKMIDDSIKQHRSVLHALTKERVAEIEERLQGELDAATGEQRAKIERELEQLRAAAAASEHYGQLELPYDVVSYPATISGIFPHSRGTPLSSDVFRISYDPETGEMYRERGTDDDKNAGKSDDEPDGS